MTSSYDWSLVLFSVFIAVFASYTTLRLAFHLVWASPQTRPYWIAGGGFAMGMGIWGMHFVGMLAMHIPVSVAYDPAITAFSVVPAILGSAIALYVVSRPQRSAAWQLLASVLMGTGIVAMHYSGMAAMQMSPPIAYDPTLFAVSVLIAVAASWAALALVFRERGDSGVSLAHRLFSAVAMGMAIAGMHYTGMAAARFEPGSVCMAAATGLSGSSIALFAGLSVVLVLVASLALTFFGEVVGENNFYKALLAAQSAAGEGVVLLERGKVVYANPAIELLSGYTESELKALPSWDLWIELDRQRTVPGATGDALLQTSSRTEVALKTRLGAVVPCEVVVSSFRHVQSTRYLLVCIDISERKASQEALLALNATLEQRVDARTRELRSTMVQLQTAQAELIQAEKMASLGALVAGISHELNTPIGNSLTVASTMQEQAQSLRLAIDQGLTRSRLVAFSKAMEEGADILVRSLQTAARLVISFKQVAVDQASVNRRRFELHTTVLDSLTMLRPMLRKTSHTVDCQIPAGIWMDSYPGPLGQVLTNLITNALVHGFDGRERGQLQVAGRLVDQTHVEIIVRDDGVGIDAENLSRVFDPFFTTKLGRGGSGLGLNIVYNLVATRLGGRIKVDSTPGHGASFTVVLPLCLPDSH
ncbi:MAG: PAS domain S-box protein [Burkholderiales bacterium]|nr:PAS domain S-box protein [Burkholderiales bacterium]